MTAKNWKMKDEEEGHVYSPEHYGPTSDDNDYNENESHDEVSINTEENNEATNKEGDQETGSNDNEDRDDPSIDTIYLIEEDM